MFGKNCIFWDKKYLTQHFFLVKICMSNVGMSHGRKISPFDLQILTSLFQLKYPSMLFFPYPPLLVFSKIFTYANWHPLGRNRVKGAESIIMKRYVRQCVCVRHIKTQAKCIFHYQWPSCYAKPSLEIWLRRNLA